MIKDIENYGEAAQEVVRGPSVQNSASRVGGLVPMSDEDHRAEAAKWEERARKQEAREERVEDQQLRAAAVDAAIRSAEYYELKDTATVIQVAKDIYAFLKGE